jgi:DNA-binding MarR family transcriptional regulator
MLEQMVGRVSPKYSRRRSVTPMESKYFDYLVRLCDEFSRLDVNFQMSYAKAFGVIAREPDLTITEYAKKLKTTQPMVSRWILQLGNKARTGGEGYKLVDTYRDAIDLRKQRVGLTTKGWHLVERLKETHRDVFPGCLDDLYNQ